MTRTARHVISSQQKRRSNFPKPHPTDDKGVRQTFEFVPTTPPTHLPLDDIRHAVASDPYWSRLLSETPALRSVHLAVFVEPFLGSLLSGQKTVESRFSVVRCPPYGRVASGDVLLVKRSGGPVVGVCEVRETWSYLLDAETWSSIRRDFMAAMCAQDPTFWERKRNASYATLMRITNARPIEAVAWKKRDRRGWVVVQGRSQPHSMESQ